MKCLFKVLFLGFPIILCSMCLSSENSDQKKPPSEPPSDSINYSIRFYGTGANDWDRIKIPVDNPPTSVDVSGDFTIEFWMKADSNDNIGGEVWPGRDGWISGHILFDRDIYGTGDYGDFGISLGKNFDKDPTGSERYIAFGVDQGGLGNGIVGNTNVADLIWHHIAVTRDGNSGDLRIFVDGVIDAELPASAARPTGDLSYRDGRSGATNDPYAVIGAEKHDVGPSWPSYSGMIEEMRISDIVRYTSDFMPSVVEFTPDENTVALYHFNEGSGTAILDSSSFGTDGTYIPIPGDQRPVWVDDTPAIQALLVLHGYDFDRNNTFWGIAGYIPLVR